jgi:hypothetical protein
MGASATDPGFHVGGKLERLSILEDLAENAKGQLVCRTRITARFAIAGEGYMEIVSVGNWAGKDRSVHWILPKFQCVKSGQL